MLNKDTTKSFYRNLYSGKGYLQTITLLKRGDDQQQGTVIAITLFRCRRKKIHKSGEQAYRNETMDFRTTWQIPREELNRVGVKYLSSADRFVETPGNNNNHQNDEGITRYWQPEADTHITDQLFENIINVDCKSVNPHPGQ